LLASLSATGFRNLEPLDWRPGPGRHLLVGGNGAGKTSLLEAVYVLATTKSFRTAQLADCVRRGASGFALDGEVEAAARVHLAVGYAAGGGKSRAVNAKPAALADHLAALPVVAWTAAEAELLTGPPELRRRFLDRGVVGLKPPVALDALARYRRALEAKRELLARPPAGGAAFAAQLAPWNELLAAAAAEVLALRRGYVERLAAELAGARAEAAAAGLALPAVDFAYRPSPRNAFDAATGELAAAVHARLERVADRERRRGMALVGPHRDELAIRWDGAPLRGNASAGERKALGLLLLAAHGRVLAAAGPPPVYLLDDADAELAAKTLAAVWPVFAGAGQLFASSNRPRAWDGLEVDGSFRVAAGRVLDGTPPGEA
jgi:DNA replication and repair protein RecF